jgi:hypothetical protein
MAAPIRFLTGRQQQQKIGVIGSTEDLKVLEVVGRAGIGTTIFDVDPGAKLQVNGAIFMAGDFASQGSDGRTGIEIGAGGGGIGTAHHRIRSAGGFGQNLTFEAQTADVFVPGGDIVFKTGGTSNRLRILKDGNIGIGTDNPTAKLDVAGTTKTQQLNVSGVTTHQGDIYLGDGDALRFGTGSSGFGDLQIFHDGQHSYVRDNGTGNLRLKTNNMVELVFGGTNEVMGQFIGNAGVGLYYNGSKKFETTASGVDVTGHTETDTLNVSGVSTFQGNVHLGDNDRLKFGDGDDLQIYHDGSNSYIEDTGDGQFYIRGSAAIHLETIGGEKCARFVTNREVELYYDNSKKFETTGAGVTVFGTIETQQLNVSGVSTFAGDVSFGSTVTFGDNDQIIMGDGSDLKIYHDGANSYISDQGTGDLRLSGNVVKFNNQANTATMIKATEGGSVELNHNGSKKFETTGVGVSIVNGTSDTATIYGPSNLIIDPMPVGVGTTSGVVRIKGDLFVDGTTTQINSTTLEIADFVVGIASTATTDLLADGAGIRIGSDKTFLYEHNGGTIPSLKSSENLNVASGKGYQINQTEVLNATTLGSGVTNSSLTSVGTLTGLSVHDGNITFRDNILFFDNTTFSTFDWQYYQADNGKIIWTVQGTGGAEMELEGDGADNTNTILRVGGYKVWNAGNDGTGSGLDADTLDGQEGSYYLDTSATSQTKLGNLTVGTATTGVAIRTDGTLNVTGVSTFTGDVNIGTGATTAFFDVSSGFVGIGTITPTEKLHVEGNALVNGNLYLNDTNYLSSLPTGNYGSVQINGDGKGNWEGYSIDGHTVFISDNSFGSFGLFDDTNNHWAIRHFRGGNSYTVLYGGNNSANFSVRGTDVRVENVPLIVNRTTLTGTASQNLQIDGGAYFSGSVGIDVTNPDFKLHIKSNFNNGGIFLEDSSTSQSSPYIRVRGKRSDNNFSQAFSGQLILEKNQTNGPTIDGRHLGAIIFGGNYDASPGVTTGMTYGASMGAISEGEFSGINTAPTALVFRTGTVGIGTLGTANINFGDTESLRINSNNNILIGSVSETGTASQKLQVTSGAYVSGDVGIGTTNPDEKLDIRGHIKLDSGPVLENAISGDILKITSPSGYLEIGPKNTLFSHFFTDRDKYFFNKRLIVDEGIISSYNEDLVLQTNNSSEERIRIKNDTGDVGIGTAAPSQRLDVNGNARLRGALYDTNNAQGSLDQVLVSTGSSGVEWKEVTAVGALTGVLVTDDSANQAQYINFSTATGITTEFNVDTSDLVYNPSTVRLGIGTTNPTAKLDVRGTLNVTGVSTFQSHVHLGDDDELRFGASNDFKIVHDPNDCRFENLNGDIKFKNTGSYFFFDEDGGETLASFINDGAVNLFYSGNKKFETTSAGINVTGHTELDDVNVSGAITATTFTGNLAGTVNTAAQPNITSVGTLTELEVTGITSSSAFADFDYLQAPFGSTFTFTVTVASKDSTHRYNGTGSDNAYLINGVQAPFLTLTPGRTYRFTNDNTGSHPLKFYLEADKTTEYTSGVSFQDTYTEIAVSDETPIVLHYQCTAHNYMGNAIQVNSNVVNTNYAATLRGGLNVTGVSTFGGNVDLGDDDQIVFGDGNDLFISSNGSNGLIRTRSGSNLIYRSSSHKFRNQAGTEELAAFTENGSVELYYDDNKKFETTGAGVSVYGITQTQQLNVTGVSTLGTVKISNDISVVRDINASGIATLPTIDTTNATIDNLTFTSGTAITSVDTDLTAVSSSDDTLASAKAIKTYVDSQITAQDLDFTADTGGTRSIDLDSETLSILGTANEIETAGSSNTVTIGLPNVVAITTSLTVGDATGITGVSTFFGDVNIGTGATTAFFDVSSGSVGIGTITPTQNLHVEGNTLVNGNLYLNDTNYLSSLPTGDYGSVQINGDGKGNWKGYSIDGHAVFMAQGSTASFGLYDDTYNHWAIRHFRGGNSFTQLFGGNQSANLIVHGTDVRVENVPLIGGGRTTLTGTASQNLQFDGGGYFSGDVGIGVTNPGSTLAVGGTITELYDGSYWNVVTQADVGYGASQVPLNQYLGQLAFLDDHHPNGLRRDGGGSDDVFVDSNGLVGINTTTPTEKLDVIGTVKAIDFDTTSDQNLKTNIKIIEDPLEKIAQIRGVNFEWKENNKPSAGVIAQEVEKVLPELVTNNGTKAVNYNGLIGLLVEAVKAQQKEIDILKSKIK